MQLLAVFTVNCLVAAALLVLGLMSSAQRLPKLEKLLRMRIPALFLAYPALWWCIPHAREVSPDFLIPWLIPLAVIMPMLCVWVLDFALLRSFTGVQVIASYLLIHYSFEYHYPLMPVWALTAWLTAALAIYVAWAPVRGRDLLRRAAARPKFRLAAIISSGVYLLLSLIGLTIAIGR